MTFLKLRSITTNRSTCRIRYQYMSSASKPNLGSSQGQNTSGLPGRVVCPQDRRGSAESGRSNFEMKSLTPLDWWCGFNKALFGVGKGPNWLFVLERILSEIHARRMVTSFAGIPSRLCIGSRHPQSEVPS